MRAFLDDDRVAPDEPLVHQYLIVAAAEPRHSSEFEVGVVARKALLARQVQLLAADSERGRDLSQIDPLRERARENCSAGACAARSQVNQLLARAY